MNFGIGVYVYLLLKNYDKIDMKELINRIKKLGEYVNEFMNNKAYGDMIYYYNIVFSLNPELKKLVPPVLKMKKI